MTTPGGGYKTLQMWLQMKGGDVLTCNKGVVDLFFDNIGKYIVKNFCVSAEKTKSADIITIGI